MCEGSSGKSLLIFRRSVSIGLNALVRGRDDNRRANIASGSCERLPQFRRVFTSFSKRALLFPSLSGTSHVLLVRHNEEQSSSAGAHVRTAQEKRRSGKNIFFIYNTHAENSKEAFRLFFFLVGRPLNIKRNAKNNLIKVHPYFFVRFRGTSNTIGAIAAIVFFFYIEIISCRRAESLYFNNFST